MDKKIIHNEIDFSVEELEMMITDIEATIFHIERFNEFLAERMKLRHPNFCAYMRAILINNSHTISYTLKVKSMLDKAMENYFMSAETTEGGHG